MEDDERKKILISRSEMRQITQSIESIHSEFKTQDRKFQTRLENLEEQINLRFEEMVKQKKQKPKTIKTELKSFQLPPSIRQDQTGAGPSSISEVHL